MYCWSNKKFSFIKFHQLEITDVIGKIFITTFIFIQWFFSMLRYVYYMHVYMHMDVGKWESSFFFCSINEILLKWCTMHSNWYRPFDEIYFNTRLSNLREPIKKKLEILNRGGVEFLQFHRLCMQWIISLNNASIQYSFIIANFFFCQCGNVLV